MVRLRQRDGQFSEPENHGAGDCDDTDCDAAESCRLCPLPEHALDDEDRRCFETMTAGEASVNELWQPVPLSRSIDDPVVITGPPTWNGTDRGLIRLRAISSSGFEARFEEWAYLDGVHMRPAGFPFLVLPAGRQVLENGIILEAGVLEVSGTGNPVAASFLRAFPGPPALFTTPQTSNGPASVARVGSVTAEGFPVGLYGESQSTAPGSSEMVGYLAIWSPPGWGDLTVDGVVEPFPRWKQRDLQNQSRVYRKIWLD